MKQLDDGLLELFYGLKSKTLRKPEASLQANVGIPVGEAREYFLGGELLFRGFQSFRFNDFEPDPNAAMIARDGGFAGQNPYHKVRADEVIARDEPTGGHTPGETWGFRIDNRQFKWLGGEIVKSTAKPAITGLTTVHDGKVSGLGFCSE